VGNHPGRPAMDRRGQRRSDGSGDGADSAGLGRRFSGHPRRTWGSDQTCCEVVHSEMGPARSLGSAIDWYTRQGAPTASGPRPISWRMHGGWCSTTSNSSFYAYSNTEASTRIVGTWTGAGPERRSPCRGRPVPTNCIGSTPAVGDGSWRPGDRAVLGHPLKWV